MIERRDREISDLKRRLAGTVIIGRISSADHKLARYRVKAGELETDWIPDTQARAGKTVTYEGRSVGEQVVLVCPAGDPTQGVIIGSVHREENQAGDKESIHRVKYPDGTIIDYDDEAHAYRMAVAPGGSFTLLIGGGVALVATGGRLTVSAPDGIDLVGEVRMNGSGVSHNGKNIGESHAHKKVMPGEGVSGPPVG